MEAASQPPLLPETETFPSCGAPMSQYIAEPWESDTQGCLEQYVEGNSYYPFVMREM
jgi:hypothetical protein